MHSNMVRFALSNVFLRTLRHSYYVYPAVNLRSLLVPAVTVRLLSNSSSKCCLARASALKWKVVEYLEAVTSEKKSLDRHISDEQMAVMQSFCDGPTVLATEDIDHMLTRSLVTIAVDPSVKAEVILTFFDICAKTGRSLIEYKHEHPEVFNQLSSVTARAVTNMNYEDLRRLSVSLNHLRGQDLKFINNLIRALCTECLSRLDKIPINEVVKFFEIVKVFDHQRGFYMPLFGQRFLDNIEHFTVQELIKLVFYCSEKKEFYYPELTRAAVAIIQKQLSDIEFVKIGILAGCLAKLKVDETRQQLNVKLSEALQNKLQETQNWKDLDLYAVYSIIELFRQERYSCSSLLCELERFILNNIHLLDMQTIPEFIAYLAQNSYNKELFVAVECRVTSILIENDPSNTSLKSLARVLWAFSSCTHECQQDFVRAAFQQLEFCYDTDMSIWQRLKYVDSLVSLAMMGHVHPQLTSIVFQPLESTATKRIGSVSALRKLLSRLSVLHECITLEHPEIDVGQFQPLPKPNVNEIELRQSRPLLAKAESLLKETCPGVGTLSTGLLQMPLVGISLGQQEVAAALNTAPDCEFLQALSKLNSDVSVEIMDNSNSIQRKLCDNYVMDKNGMLTFKLRLLNKMGWKYIVLSAQDLHGSVKFKELLLDKLSAIV